MSDRNKVPPRKRTIIHQVFKDRFAQYGKKNNASMDELCNEEEMDTMEKKPKLLMQQRFLLDYVQKYPLWDNLLLYHAVGSGKTLTSILIAEAYLADKEKRGDIKPRVIVILPARLLTNYWDELMLYAPEKYISLEDKKAFYDPESSVTMSEKIKIKNKFERKVSAYYSFFSFEKFRKMALLPENIQDVSGFMRAFTHNALVIVDEAHNLLSNTFMISHFNKALHKNIIDKSTVTNSMLFMLMAHYLYVNNQENKDTSKLLLMTATPIFDNVNQVRLLTLAMRPDKKDLLYKKEQENNKIPAPQDNMTLLQVLRLLRGRVSYFKGASLNAYPKVNHKIVEVPMSYKQIISTEPYARNRFKIPHPDDWIEMDVYLAAERILSLFALPYSSTKNDIYKPSVIQMVSDDLPMYGPKVHHLFERIEQHPYGKHAVYSTFIAKGIGYIAELLKKRGWIDLKDAVNDPQGEWKAHAYRVFLVWDGSLKNTEKQRFKAIVNSRENITGEKCRVILGSPSIREGITLKHVQHMHIIDPVWNENSFKQLEGRVIRFCSHADIFPEHIEKYGLSRSVTVHIYILQTNSPYFPYITADEHIYECTIPRKRAFVHKAEYILQTMALDHYLHKNPIRDTKDHIQNYIKKENISALTDGSTPASELSLDQEHFKIPLMNKLVFKGSTCPKSRVPPCEPKGMYYGRTLQGDRCCYKKPQKGQHMLKPKISDIYKGCPKSRRPDQDGECHPEDTMFKQRNKHGVMCCYKNKKPKNKE